MRTPTSRRFFLRGLGGAALAVPVLSSLLPRREARAQADAAPPLRFVFTGALFGRDLRAWYPAEDPTARSPEGVLYKELAQIAGPISYTLGSAFDPLRKKITLVRGLDALNIGDAHSPTLALTASGGRPNGPGFGCSFDAALEESKSFYPELPMISALRSSVNPSGRQVCYSYTARVKPGQPLWHEIDPRVIYDKYFNPVTAAASAERSRYKRGIINDVMEDYRRVSASTRIAADDRRRLDNYMQLMADAERRLGVTRPQCSRGAQPPAMADAESLHAATMDLEVAALACGMTKIVCHNFAQYSSEINYSDEPGHSSAHGHTSDSKKGLVTQHAIHNKWVMDQVARFLSKLDAVSEGNGTLLDNTFFLYGNTEARGFHSMLDMPVLVAGGGGKIKTGYYLDYRPRPLKVLSPSLEVTAGRPYNHLLIAGFRALGIAPSDYQRFGWRGFGLYRGFDGILSEHYAPFLSSPDEPLPYLLA